jgi:hypothetical protein
MTPFGFYQSNQSYNPYNDYNNYDSYEYSSSSSDHDSSGFAAEAPVNALQTLVTQDTRYKPDIEEDKVVTANGDYVGDVGAF